MVDLYSTFWTEQRNSAVDLFADHNPSSLNQDIHRPDTLHRSYSQPTFSVEECGLLHPQPGFVHRAPSMTGEEIRRRYSSPTCSSTSVQLSTVSATWSERHDTPRLSPEVVNRVHLGSSLSFRDDFAYASGSFDYLSRNGSSPNIHCVAMDEVQKFADEQPEGTFFSFEGDTHAWTESDYHASGYPAPYPEEGYHPMDHSMIDEASPIPYHSTSTTSDCPTRVTSRHESEEQGRPNTRHRRTASSATTITTTRTPTSKVCKRPANSRRSSSHRSVKPEPEEDYSDVLMASANNKFPCTFVNYGCLSKFGNKNEWKRHIQTQHMRLEYWRCEQCLEAQDSGKPNDFNRRDLFVQHVIRMHPFSLPMSPTGKKSKKPAGRGAPRSEPEQQYLDSEATRCHRQSRQPPESSRCVVCEQHFHGSGTWEQRLEHIGRHFEDSKKGSDAAPPDSQNWHIDYELEKYLLHEGIVVERGQRLVLVDGKRDIESE